MRCLEKDPWDRFATTAELWSELQNVTFFPPTADIRPSSGPAKTPLKVAAAIAAIGLIGGFMAGRALYQVPEVATAPPSSVAAKALVSGWLETADGGDTLAFEPSATVMHMAIDTHDSSTTHVAPTRLHEHQTIQNRLAGVVGRPLEVLRFGDIAIVSGSYETPDPACGKAWFTLRSRNDSWRIMHLRLQDIVAACEPGVLAAADNI
jgi:hypothetical protein